jgi:hypothetical protein
MKILAIDPGNEYSAYVVYEDRLIIKKEKALNAVVLDMIENRAIYPAVYYCEMLAIEAPACYGLPVGHTTLETSEWVGVFRHAFGMDNSYRVYRKSQNKEHGIDSVTMHLCNSTRAKDPNVRQAIIDLYGGQDKAIGNKKCPKCKGKGWYGAGRPECPVCHGDKWKHPPGPLCGVAEDVWAALAVAITFSETYKEIT